MSSIPAQSVRVGAAQFSPEEGRNTNWEEKRPAEKTLATRIVFQLEGCRSLIKGLFLSQGILFYCSRLCCVPDNMFTVLIGLV